MTSKILVKDNNTQALVYMWEVDAEEAVRYDPARYTVQAIKPPPKKNPGGRGY